MHEIGLRWWEKGRTWYFKYERRLTSLAMVFGFVVDSLTLTRIDLLLDNLILLSYLTIAGAGIALINLYDGGALSARFVKGARPWAPLFIQFAFGGLFSGFLVFYSRSASLAASWPFLLFLLLFLIGNEFFRRRYQRLTFQASIFFIALFSYAIFFVPIVTNSMGPLTFLLSGAVSLAIITALLYGLAYLIPEYVRRSRYSLTVSIVSIFLAIQFLYFFNIIPPIPLSLKESGVYHSVSRNGNSYIVEREIEPWYTALRPYENIKIIRGNPIYFYSAVFAPTDLNITIVHRWQYHDKKRDEWVTATTVHFPIFGGRDGGYRGYSTKTSLFPGWWRVNVETERGQLLGRERIKIEEIYTQPKLETVSL